MVRVIDLYDALSYFADTLTEFRIILRRPFMVSITRILSICSQLKSLHCSLLLVIEYFRTSIPPLNVSLLEHFHLHVSRNKLFASNLEAILLHTPHLRSLFVSSHGEDLLPAIIRQCPKIEAVNTGFLNPRDDDYYKHRDHIISPRYPYFTGINSNSKRCTSTKDKEGQLKVLALGPVKSIQPLQEQLKLSYNSLQYLCLSPAKSDNDNSPITTLATPVDNNGADSISDNCWQPLFTSVMPNLTYLFILFKQCPLKFREQLPSILRCCPNLKTLRFTGYTYETSRSMLLSQVTFRTLEAISQLDKLSQLLIRDVHIDAESLSWLLKHCSRTMSHDDDMYDKEEYNYHSTLRVLDIKIPSGRLSTTLLTYIARIKSLEKLTVLLPNVGNVKVQDVAHFCKKLMSLPNLFSLTLGYIAINTEAAQCLTTSKTVSYLRIEDADISEDSIKMLRDNIMNVCIYYSDDDNV